MPAAIARGRDGERLTEDELTALFAETRPEAIEDLRQAADELRAELAGDTVTFVVNRNINVSNVCIVGCAFCGFGQGKRSPDAYEHDARSSCGACVEAVDYGATEICMQSGIHPDWALEDYLGWLRLAKEHRAAAPPARLQPDGDRAHVRHLGAAAGRGLRAPARGRAGLDAGHGRRGPARRRPRAHQPQQAAGRRGGCEIIEATHAAGLRSTATVMFGHIEEPWELAEHMRVVRELQERTGGITEFVPLSFIPFHTLLGRTHGVEEISREENLKHTAVFRLALGRTIPSLQASWVKMGLEVGHRGAVLGRQRPRRHADGGEHQPPGRLLSRRAPRSAAADRGRARGRAPRRRAHHALRASPSLARRRRAV